MMSQIAEKQCGTVLSPVAHSHLQRICLPCAVCKGNGERVKQQCLYFNRLQGTSSQTSLQVDSTSMKKSSFMLLSIGTVAYLVSASSWNRGFCLPLSPHPSICYLFPAPWLLWTFICRICCFCGMLG